MHSTAHSVPLVCLLSQSNDLGVNAVGIRVKKLTELTRNNLLVPETLIFTRQFFSEIFIQNDFEKIFYDIFRLTPWGNPDAVLAQSEIAREYILHAKIPRHFSDNLTPGFMESLDEAYFAIRPSFIVDKQNQGHYSDLHVRGAANVMESLLRVWSRMYAPEELQKRADEFQSGQMIPAAIIVQQMIDANVSGYISLDHHLGGTQASIFSTWGIMKRDRHFSQMDIFKINLKNHEIVSQEIGQKTEEHRHRLDGLHPRKLPFPQQGESSLTLIQIEQLLQVITHLHHKLIFPQKIEWSILGENVYILGVYEADQSAHALPSKKILKQSISATPSTVLLLTSDPQTNCVLSPSVTGVVFDANAIIKQLNIHPEQAVEDDAAQVKEILLQALLKTHHAFPKHSFIYRASHFDSFTLGQMHVGSQREFSEVNPLLGFRGALRALRKPVVLDLELDALTDFYKQTNHRVAVTMPWTRSTGELKWLKNHLHNPEFGTAPFLESWLECSTPENILNISQYIDVGIQGIIIDIDTLSALLYGIDLDNSDISNLYSTDHSLLQSLLQPLVQRAQKELLPVFVLVRQWQKEWGELASTLQVTGVVIEEKDIEICLPYNQS